MIEVLREVEQNDSKQCSAILFTMGRAQLANIARSALGYAQRGTPSSQTTFIHK